jgi:hypothetical protein
LLALSRTDLLNIKAGGLVQAKDGRAYTGSSTDLYFSAHCLSTWWDGYDVKTRSAGTALEKSYTLKGCRE